MTREHGDNGQTDRREFTASLSVVAIISNDDSTQMLLVKDRKSGKWQPPAGGLRWKDSENRLETFLEGITREVQEETSIELTEEPHFISIVNVPGTNKNHIGAVYSAVVRIDQGHELLPVDGEEIEAVKFFTEKELVELLREQDMINRPEFNKGIIAWWLRNEARVNWDPYGPFRPSSSNPKDRNSDLNERYLQHWATKSGTEGLYDVINF